MYILYFDKKTMTITIGQNSIITVTVNPLNASNKNILWTSSNTAIATVIDGTVTGVSGGSATITATTTDGSNKSASCIITVNTPVVSSSIGISLAVNGTTTLLTNILPVTATNKNVSWSSSNTAIATVVNGLVTGKTVGSATISSTTTDGAKVSTIIVTVR